MGLLKGWVIAALSACFVIGGGALACSSFAGSSANEDAGTSALDAGPPEAASQDGALDAASCPPLTTTGTTFSDGSGAPTADVQSDGSFVFWRTKDHVFRRSLDGAGPIAAWDAGETISSLVLTAHHVTHLKGSVIVSHQKEDLGKVFFSTDSDWSRLFGDTRSPALIALKGVVVARVEPPGFPAQLYSDLDVSAAAFFDNRILLYGPIQGGAPVLTAYPPSDAGLPTASLVTLATDGTEVFYADPQGNIVDFSSETHASRTLAAFEPAPVEHLVFAGENLFYRTPGDIRRLGLRTACVDIVEVGSFGSFSVSGNHVFATFDDSVLDIAIQP